MGARHCSRHWGDCDKSNRHHLLPSCSFAHIYVCVHMQYVLLYMVLKFYRGDGSCCLLFRKLCFQDFVVLIPEGCFSSLSYLIFHCTNVPPFIYSVVKHLGYFHYLLLFQTARQCVPLVRASLHPCGGSPGKECGRGCARW